MQCIGLRIDLLQQSVQALQKQVQSIEGLPKIVEELRGDLETLDGNVHTMYSFVTMRPVYMSVERDRNRERDTETVESGPSRTQNPENRNETP